MENKNILRKILTLKEWGNNDFVIENNVVKGFSVKGKEKVKGNKDLLIPHGVTTIGSGAFLDNQLKSVIIPNSVTTIGSSAFAINKLTSVTIPNSVTTIGGSAFENNQLKSVIIPNSVTTIRSCTFKNNKLTSVIIPNSVTIIGSNAFAINKLTSITIPNSATTIGSCAFANNRLISLTIPNSVTRIGDYAFYNNKLTNVTILNSVTRIGDYAFIEQKITLHPEQNPFKFENAGICLKGLKENINDISSFVKDYKYLKRENGKISFPKDNKKITLETKEVPKYQYSANITIYNPGKYVKDDDGTIIPIPKNNKEHI
ncbi:leucine-rich repeat domain-containing protein [Peptoniphilus timonensis]|uniref:leucine-rich repeat domain-containing protein n=1 Tax=Peptoniphilus timonensis TaxID=1268254 RepID=UPI0003128486|nr:leucine-rich repeat domain-containing protein [Peptoniphilus timonensis]